MHSLGVAFIKHSRCCIIVYVVFCYLFSIACEIALCCCVKFIQFHCCIIFHAVNIPVYLPTCLGMGIRVFGMFLLLETALWEHSCSRSPAVPWVVSQG